MPIPNAHPSRFLDPLPSAAINLNSPPPHPPAKRAIHNHFAFVVLETWAEDVLSTARMRLLNSLSSRVD